MSSHYNIKPLSLRLILMLNLAPKLSTMPMMGDMLRKQSGDGNSL
jgi:hypothetical protein